MTRRLHVRRFGDRTGGALVCLHGVTAWGGHFRRLATEGLDGRLDVLAPDLLGHGDSPREPPWRISSHVDALLASLPPTPAAWLGHSFGARLALEVAARAPERVTCLVLLDPAIHVPPHVALFAAESARPDRSYTSVAEAIASRSDESGLERTPVSVLEDELGEHLAVDPHGHWRYRYTQAAVVVAHGELAVEPPAFAAARVPTLVVLGAGSYLPYDLFLDAHRRALGELLQVTTVPGGHTVLWDAFDETSVAIRAFLAHGRGTSDPSRER